LPGLPELVESIEHLVHDGHLPHSEQHAVDQHAESHQGLDEEHGCTPIAHRCGCHVSAPAILASGDTEVSPPFAPDGRRPTWVEDEPTNWANAPPTRPPIA